MKNLKAILINAGLALTLGACAHKDDNKEMVNRDYDKDSSHNIFTGSDTVTETDQRTYKDYNTGEKTKKTVTKKAKYDKNGNKISDKSEYEAESR